MRQDGENKFCCSPPVKGCLLLAHFIVSLHVSCNVGTPFPWNSIWGTKVPLRVAFFSWSLVLEKILTMKSFMKQYVIVIDRCCLYKRNGDSMDHHLLHCKVACALRNAFSSCFG
jgi:hypothetical protein